MALTHTATKEQEKEDDYGVLLYYKYTHIPDVNQLLEFYNTNCSSLSLLGRVRLSSHGVNVTVGGNLSALEKHIETMKSNSLFDGTDFKLASSHKPANDKVARECGFSSLSIRIVKELVTLSSNPLPKAPEISNAGRHLSAVEFHSVIHDAGQIQGKGCSSGDKKLVLLDARNLYETRIGKFHTPHVSTLDPQIRQYSDLPSWVENNLEQLRGNNILMYCTGGIRCEMASAYIKSKGPGFENVFQLFGGVQRYMEQFPDGGFFKGKNFVFDHRVSVGSNDSTILGSCLLCRSPFDDYTSRSRCTFCRMLVLVCDKCREKNSLYVCELCQKNKSVVSVPPVDEDSLEISQPVEVGAIPVTKSTAEAPSQLLANGPRISRRLKILCLHGFRQNASSFKGRTASLTKKLKNIAEFVYVDAPHELSFIYQPILSDKNLGSESFALQHTAPPPSQNCQKKFAWLVAPDYSGKDDADWKPVDRPFDSLQYLEQDEGLDVSLAHLEKTFRQAGPFDGILGFSQGAAMAALVCQQRGKPKSAIDFRFVILCSGFAVNASKLPRGSINCPSLHVFGNEKGKDRQIDGQASRDLASLFEDGCSVVIEHDLGHIIPTRSPYIDEIKDFLSRFL